VPPVPLLGKEAVPNPNAKITAGKEVPIEFAIGVSGSYAAVQSFLSGLQDLRRVISIKSLVIAPDRNVQQSSSESATTIGGYLQLNLKVTSYYLVQ
jgi:Tfp pilus assembly protein PilO